MKFNFPTIKKSMFFSSIKINDLSFELKFLLKNREEIKELLKEVDTSKSTKLKNDFENINSFNQYLREENVGFICDLVSEREELTIKELFFELDIDYIGRSTTTNFFFENIIKYIFSIKHSLYERNIRKDTLSIRKLNEIKKNLNTNDNIWYRGQSNSDWSITPAYLRGVKRYYGTSSTLINSNTVEQDYIDKGLLDRYSIVYNYTNIDYNFLSYMQHAVSYSPLVDFTDSPIIASTFALSNTNQFNDFNHISSAIYEFDLKQENYILNVDVKSFDENDIKSDGSMYRCENDFEINKILRFMNIIDCDVFYINEHFTSIPTIDEILLIFCPDIIFIDLPTNDRMKYQRGKFVLFNNCITIKGKVFYELNTKFNFKKYVINCKSKRSIIDHIKKKNNEQYKLSNLLDPYKWLNE
ncbi:MAG: FRG domain-containing protein [bacterium]